MAGGIGYGGIVEIFLPPGGTTGQVLTKASDANYDFAWGAGVGSTSYTEVVATFDNGNAVLPVGDTKTYYEVRSAGTLIEWALTGNPAGNVVIDVWKAAGAIPTAADSITAAAPPFLVGTALGNSAALTGWTTAVAVGDVFGFGIVSAAGITKAVLTLKLQKP